MGLILQFLNGLFAINFVESNSTTFRKYDGGGKYASTYQLSPEWPSLGLAEELKACISTCPFYRCTFLLEVSVNIAKFNEALSHDRKKK